MLADADEGLGQADLPVSIVFCHEISCNNAIACGAYISPFCFAVYVKA